MDWLKRGANLHNNIGQDLAKLGGVLRCKTCGYEESIKDHPLGTYLRKGWPKHCDHTMVWVTQRQLDEEKQERS